MKTKKVGMDRLIGLFAFCVLIVLVIRYGQYSIAIYINMPGFLLVVAFFSFLMIASFGVKTFLGSISFLLNFVFCQDKSTCHNYVIPLRFACRYAISSGVLASLIALFQAINAVTHYSDLQSGVVSLFLPFFYGLLLSELFFAPCFAFAAQCNRLKHSDEKNNSGNEDE